MKVSAASTSVAERVPTVVPTDASSATVVAESAMSAGASLTLVMAIVNCFSVERPSASVDRTRTE